MPMLSIYHDEFIIRLMETRCNNGGEGDEGKDGDRESRLAHVRFYEVL